MMQEDDKGLAELILKPYIIEILLILTKEGPQTDKKIVEEFRVDKTEEIKIKHMLGEMRGFELIDHHESIVYITSYGETILKKLKKDSKDEDK